MLAVGAAANSPPTGGSAGHVRVYQYVNNVWSRLGSDIDGEANCDRSGRSISLSGDGSVLAIGAAGNDPNGQSDARHVRVYKYVNNAWSRLGIDIDGEAANDWSERSIS